jgi:hypothetical protein
VISIDRFVSVATPWQGMNGAMDLVAAQFLSLGVRALHLCLSLKQIASNHLDLHPLALAKSMHSQKVSTQCKGRVTQQLGLLIRCALNAKLKMFRSNLLHFLKPKKLSTGLVIQMFSYACLALRMLAAFTTTD